MCQCRGGVSWGDWRGVARCGTAQKSGNLTKIENLKRPKFTNKIQPHKIFPGATFARVAWASTCITVPGVVWRYHGEVKLNFPLHTGNCYLRNVRRCKRMLPLLLATHRCQLHQILERHQRTTRSRCVSPVCIHWHCIHVYVCATSVD